MALSPITPRDRLQSLVDLARKTWRYWWLVAVFAVVGGGLSLAFALTRPRAYQSWAVLFYQERIQTGLLSPNREESVQRGIGDRYRELLLARAQLQHIIGDPKLDPFPKEKDPDVKIDKLRLVVRFESRGANAFRIVFTDSDPDRARRVVEKLTKLLQERDESLRNELAANTVAFVTEQEKTGNAQLRKTEQALNEFLARHPEFVSDSNTAQNEGAAFRASKPKAPVVTGNSRLAVLERQRARIQQRLEAPADAPPITVQAPMTPERQAAEAAVAEAQRAVSAANRALLDAQSKFTEKHPSVIGAQERLDTANQALRAARAAVPPDVETVVRPATAEDRVKLQREIQQIEQQIAAEQNRSGKTPEATEVATDRVVKLETEYADLRRARDDARERAQTFADQAFRAKQDADQKRAEQGGRLSIVDPAFRPVQPSGPGKTIFLMAGMILFLSLGLSLAVGLAVIDDRLYRRVDIDSLGITVLAVIPPHDERKHKRARRSATKPRGEDA